MCVCVRRECEQWGRQAMGKGQLLKHSWLRSLGRTDRGGVTAVRGWPAGGRRIPSGLGQKSQRK